MTDWEGPEVTGWERPEVTGWERPEVMGWEEPEGTGWAGSDASCDPPNTKDETTLWAHRNKWPALEVISLHI